MVDTIPSSQLPSYWAPFRGLAVIDDMISPQPLKELRPLRRARRRDNPSADGLSKLHGKNAHPAGPLCEHPLASSHLLPGQAEKRVPVRHASAAERRRLRKRQALGHRNEPLLVERPDGAQGAVNRGAEPEV